MRLARRALVPLALLSASGCSFLVDFNELQRGGPKGVVDGGEGGATGAGGGGAGDGDVDASSGGSTTEGGVTTDGGRVADSGDSGPHCATDCNDNNPCTVDTCTSTGCTNTYTAGVVPDGLSETLTADTFHRVTLSSYGNQFYLAAFKTQALRTDVELHHFGKAEAQMSAAISLAATAGITGSPVSVLDLAPTPALELVGYAAFGTALSKASQVYRIRFDASSLKVLGTLPAAADANYVGDGRMHPVTWALGGGDAWGAWPGNGNGVYIHSGTTTAAAGAAATLSTTSQVVALAPLGAGTVPGVLYVSDHPYVQAVGQATPVPLGECDQNVGVYTSALSGLTSLGGVWIGGWSKAVGAQVLTEQLPIVCGANASGAGCLGSLKCPSTPTTQILPNVRNPAVTFATVQGDPAGRMYELLALPAVDTKSSTSSLSLDLIQVDIDPKNTSASTTTQITDPPVELTSGTLRRTEGPNFPAISFIGPDIVAVAWIQPGTGATGDELHVERERLCLPKK